MTGKTTRKTWLILAVSSAAGMAIWSGQAHSSTSLALVNAISTSGGVTVSKDLTYGDAPLQNLDVYYPKALSEAIESKTIRLDDADPAASGQPNNAGMAGAGYPLVLFVHGGSWEGGNKDQYKFVGESFAKAGYVTAVINYRKAPEHVYPDYVKDTAKAIAWVYQNADTFHADNQRYAVVGHSAGAFNAVAAVSNADFLSPYGMQPSDISAVVGMAGPYSYDFRNYDSRTAFPDGGDPDNIMPDRLIKAGSSGEQPNYLLLIAENDDIVDDRNTENMTAALQAVNADVQTGNIKGASHATSIGAMSTSLTWLNDAREQVLTYLSDQIKQ